MCTFPLNPVTVNLINHLRRVCLVVAVWAGLVTIGAATESPSQEQITELIQQLGSEEFREREAATRVLQKLGYHARAAVAEAKDSTDPEIRSRARTLWEALRWMMMPDDDGDVEKLVAAIHGHKVEITAWERVIEQHGTPTIALILELRKEAKFIKSVQMGMLAYLNWLDLMGIETELVPLLDDTHDLLGLLDSIAPRNGNVTTAVNRLRLYDRMNAEDRLYHYGPLLWRAWPHESVLDEVAFGTMSRAPFANFWPDVGRQLYYQDDMETLCDDLMYYITTAHKLQAPYIVRHLIDIADPADADPLLLQPITDLLLRTNLSDELAILVQDTNDAPLLYQRYLATGKKGGDWETVVAAADTEPECFRLAQLLKKHEPARVAPMLERVLELNPTNTILDGRACSWLAKHYEDIADFSKAADFYEQALKIIKQTDRQLSGLTPAYIASHIESLRARDTDVHFTELLDRGRQALATEDYVTAVTAFREAAALQPESAYAHTHLFDAYKTGNYFDDLRDAGRKAIAFAEDDINGNIRAASISSDIMDLDKALAFANQAVEQSRDSAQCYLSRAFVLERLGRYEEAQRDLRNALALDDRGGAQAYQALGLVQAEQGNLRAAVRNFEKAMHGGGDIDYLWIWTYAIHQRLGFDSSKFLANYTQCRQFDTDDWIGYLFAFCLGEMNANELLAAAQQADMPGVTAGHVCEAQFLIGQRHLANGDLTAAETAFEAAVATNVTVFIEFVWSRAELARLRN
jgi:tetratricopeptide (TPR) repeat protein